MEIHNVIIGLLLLALLFPVACSQDGSPIVKDSCSQGATMIDPRIGEPFDPQSAAASLLIEWDIGTLRGADLPERYFEHVTLSPQTDDSVMGLVDSVGKTGQRQITVVFTNLASYISVNTTVELYLEFPDRLNFIACSHAGMRDRYLLKVVLHFTIDGRLLDSELFEIKELGAI